MLIDYLIPAFFMGLFSAGHCFGMCGGISAALSFATPKSGAKPQLAILLSYNFGRIASYTLMGALAGTLTSLISQNIEVKIQLPFLRIFAAIMLILTGFYLSGWWKALRQLERLGGFFWRFIQPLSKKIFPVTSTSKALALGGLWGWLPCGLVYSALAFALSSAQPLTAALAMLSFGAGTLPALMLIGIGGASMKALMQKTSVRALSGIAFIVFGLWTLYSVLGHVMMDHSTMHHPVMNHSTMNHPTKDHEATGEQHAHPSPTRDDAPKNQRAVEKDVHLHK